MDESGGNPLSNADQDSEGRNSERDNVSPDLAARIGEALALADGQRRYDLALRVIRATAALATDAEQRGISTRDRAEALLCEGDIFFRMGRYADSLRVSARAVHLTPMDAHAWYNIASVFSAVGDEARAMRIVERGLTTAQPSHNLGLLLCKGVSLSNQRHFREALVLFTSLQQRLPASSAVWTHTAETLLGLGRAAEAVAPARRAVSLPLAADVFAWTALGEALRRTGDQAGAQAAYEEQLRYTQRDRRAQAGIQQIFASELQRERRWISALWVYLRVQSLLLLGWAERFRMRAEVDPEIAIVVKEEQLDRLWSAHQMN